MSIKFTHVQVKWNVNSATVQDKYMIDGGKVSYEKYCEMKKENTSQSISWHDDRQVVIDPLAIDKRNW